MPNPAPHYHGKWPGPLVMLHDGNIVVDEVKAKAAQSDFTCFPHLFFNTQDDDFDMEQCVRDRKLQKDLIHKAIAEAPLMSITFVLRYIMTVDYVLSQQ